MIEIVQASTDAQLDQVRDLMRAMIAWQRQRYHDVVELVDKYHDKSGFEADLASLPGRYTPPKGRLLLALTDGQPAGCVAMHDLGQGICEMKRNTDYAAQNGIRIMRRKRGRDVTKTEL